jgi:hypothetical protein
LYLSGFINVKILYEIKIVIVVAINVISEKKNGKILFTFIHHSIFAEFRLNQIDLDKRSITEIIMILQTIQAIIVQSQFIAIT